MLSEIWPDIISMKIVSSVMWLINIDYRGLYLAALVHHEGRILVTGDDVIPMIDVDTEFSSATLNTDLYWLMKVMSIICSL